MNYFVVVTSRHKCIRCAHKIGSEWGYSDSICAVWNEIDKSEQLKYSGVYDNCKRFEMNEDASIEARIEGRGW